MFQTKRTAFLLLVLSLLLAPNAKPLSADSLNESRDLFTQAEKSWKETKWVEANNKFKDLIAKHPDSPYTAKAYLFTGLYLKSRHKYDESTATYQKIRDNFPGTHDAAEALARIACNYHVTNQDEKSLELFRQAAGEATTWEQRKYAAGWAKYLHFSLAAKKNKKTARTCASEVLVRLFDSLGVPVKEEDVINKLPLDKNYTASMLQMVKLSGEYGLKLYGSRASIADLKELPKPLIASVKPNHFILITETGESKVKVYDPGLGNVSYFWNELEPIWENKVLSLSEKPPLLALTNKQMENVKGGTCYCCPALPRTTCNQDNGDCGYCEGDFSPSNSGGAGGCCKGMPVASVEMTSQSLTLKDTPIAYKPAIGPEVSFQLMFNSDESRSGIVGNGWILNYEMSATENPDDSVTILRSGGMPDTFTESGGDYNPPTGSTNVLTKNQDDTFALEYVKDHRKFKFDTTANDGKLLEVEDQYGQKLLFSYDGNGKLTEVKDASNRSNTLAYDNNGRLTQITDPLNRTASFAYDGSGNLTRITDMAGYSTTFTCNGYNDPASMTTPKGTTNFSYGGWSSEVWVAQITDPASKIWSYGGESTTYMTDPNSRTTSHTRASYYSTDPGTITDAKGNTVSYDYDSSRNRTRITDKRGSSTSYYYDSARLVTKKTDPLSHTTEYAYDSDHNLTRTIDPANNITDFYYDTNNSLTRTTYPDSTYVSYAYDNNGKMTSLTDQGGHTTIYTYDSYGNLTRIIDPLSKNTDFGYDTIGRKTSATDPNGNTTIYTYDDLDRITQITHPGNTTTGYYYDCCKLTRVEDENSNAVSYYYDVRGKLTKTRDALSKDTVYVYDDAGNRTRMIDANNNATSYAYDQINQLTRLTYPNSTYEAYYYDQNGNLTQKRNPDSANIEFSYDINNQLTQVKKE